MDFPMTKSYIATIIARYDFYKRRGEFTMNPSRRPELLGNNVFVSHP